MLRTVKIDKFRGFPSFELQNLGRLNLLVGTNNSGKTSILEAIQLLCSRSNLEPLIETMRKRGEYFVAEDIRRPRRELDIRHLFYNHEIEPGSQFSVSGVNANISESFTASIKLKNSRRDGLHIDAGDQLTIFENEDFDGRLDDRVLEFTTKWMYGENEEIWERPLSINGGLDDEYIRRFRAIGIAKKNQIKTQFINSSALTAQKMIELFEEIVLTPEENLLQEALQIVDPNIERIASVSSKNMRLESRLRLESRDGFVVRLRGKEQRVPIGSMGDGIWRMLGLALATVGAADGVLFVDEIDTGLHFSTMSDMWRLIWGAAKRLNVQVFATTHSSDCWTSLASLASQEDTEENGITIQRIERDKSTSIVFNEREIVIAANRGIEVR